MKLEFIKGSRILGLQTGYYFGEEFLSRYKNQAIDILRKRIEDKGSSVGDMSRTSWEKGKEICPEEWEAVSIEYQKSKERIEKTREKKKPYYARLNQDVIKRKVLNLNARIEFLEEKKKRIILDINDRINLLKKEIEQMENRGEIL